MFRGTSSYSTNSFATADSADFEDEHNTIAAAKYDSNRNPSSPSTPSALSPNIKISSRPTRQDSTQISHSRSSSSTSSSWFSGFKTPTIRNPFMSNPSQTGTISHAEQEFSDDAHMDSSDGQANYTDINIIQEGDDEKVSLLPREISSSAHPRMNSDSIANTNVNRFKATKYKNASAPTINEEDLFQREIRLAEREARLHLQQEELKEAATAAALVKPTAPPPVISRVPNFPWFWPMMYHNIEVFKKMILYFLLVFTKTMFL